MFFNFEFLHRRLSTNTFLKMIGITEGETCTFCQNEAGILFHLFWECEKSHLFFNSVFSQLQSCKIASKEDNLQVDVALGLRPDD